MKKEEILERLNALQGFKLLLEQRMTDGLKPVHEVCDTEKVTPLNEEAIQQRTCVVANQLISDSSVRFPLLISVMNGALPFAAAVQNNLLRQHYRFQFETISVSSYQGTCSGELSIQAKSKILMAGRDVIVIDDVCDTGKTYHALKNLFMQQGARSVKLMVLVDKAQARASTDANPTYVGFTVSADDFIVGCGMDYEELLRNVPFIGGVDPTTLPTPEEKQWLAQEKDLNKQLNQIEKNRCVLIEQLTLMREKVRVLRQEGFVVAATAGEGLLQKMDDYVQQLFTQKMTEEVFHVRCIQAITDARPVLEQFGWKEIVANLLLAVMGLGVVYVAACTLNQAITGHFLFFRPDLARKVDVLENRVLHVAPAA